MTQKCHLTNVVFFESLKMFQSASFQFKEHRWCRVDSRTISRKIRSALTRKRDTHVFLQVETRHVGKTRPNIFRISLYFSLTLLAQFSMSISETSTTKLDEHSYTFRKRSNEATEKQVQAEKKTADICHVEISSTFCFFFLYNGTAEKCWYKTSDSWFLERWNSQRTNFERKTNEAAQQLMIR